MTGEKAEVWIVYADGDADVDYIPEDIMRLYYGGLLCLDEVLSGTFPAETVVKRVETGPGTFRVETYLGGREVAQLR